MTTTPAQDEPQEIGTRNGRSARSKGGRPKKAESERRRRQYTVAFSDAEDEDVRRRAEAAGLAVRVYVREAALGMRVSARADEQALYQLSRIGVNVNQLVRQANASGRLPELGKLEEMLHMIRTMMERL